MSETNKPFINMDALRAPAQPPVTKKSKITQKKKEKKEKSPSSTRQIKFVKKGITNGLSLSFFVIFFVMAIVLLLYFGRFTTMTRLALSKEVKSEDIIQQVNQDKQDNDMLIYKGTHFLQTWLTVSKADGEREKRELLLKPYLAKNLTLTLLESSTSDYERLVKSVEFIKSRVEIAGEDEKLTYLTYNVIMSENDKDYQAQVQFPVSFKEKDFKVVNVPTFLNVSLSENDDKNDTTYKAEQFLTVGEKVGYDEQANVSEFIDRFFDMYVKNDSNIKLIANVAGIEGATLERVNIKNMVHDSKNDDQLIVEGTVQFYFEEKSSFNSFFKLTIKQTKDSYFILKMNDE